MAKKDADMFGLKQTGGKTWSARLTIPRDRQRDVGEAFGTRSGIKQDAIMSLQTRDKNEAIQRRGAALEALRSQVNEKLAAIGKRPLEGNWKPRTVTERAVTDALSAKKVIEEASTAYSPDRDADGRVNENVPTNERDHLHHVLTNQAEDVAESLSDEEGHQYLSTFMDTLEGRATPLGPLADRWLASESKMVSNGLIDRHKRVLSVFGEYLASGEAMPESKPARSAARTGAASQAVLRAFPVQRVDKRQARRFREWVEDRKAANTVNAYLSSLRSFWTWLVDAGEVESNPWAGMSRGLKKQAKREIASDAEKRPFTEAELLALLTGEPNSRDARMVQTIHDVFRLGLLTGARQNELCSLTVDRVVVSDDPERLWGISITKDVAKTDNSIRTIPLHPLVRPIIERRLAAAKATGELDAPLFPECPPGGSDSKRGWTFSKHFLRYRKALLGDAGNGTDFHSTRRCFATFMETALANGASACSELVCDHLIGHKSERLAANTYAAKRFDWALYSEAILGMVSKGMPERVREALSD